LSKPKRERLSRELVLQAAVSFADEHGIESLSMRRLGQELGVEAMSLYNHIKNKDDLLDAMVEIVVADIEAPKVGGDWREAMRRRANSAHDALLAHPWATMLLVSRANVGPRMLRYVEATVGCLVEAGFSYVLADRAWNAIDSHVYGFTLQELNFPFDPSEYGEVAKQFLPMLPADEFPHMRALSELVIEGKHDGLQDFSFGLEILLVGLEALR
jgi:AcrR family transcriptional regulator